MLREARHKSRKAPSVTETVGTGAVSKTTQKKMEAVERNVAPGVAGPRSRAAAKRQAKALAEKRDVDAALEAIGSPYRTSSQPALAFDDDDISAVDNDQKLFTDF
jgi:hypothetical protein